MSTSIRQFGSRRRPTAEGSGSKVRTGFRLAIAGAAVLAVFLYGFALGKWRVFPNDFIAGLASEPEPAATEPSRTQFDYFAPNVDVVFLGDSITAGGNWHDMFPEVSLANRGVGSDRLADIDRRLADIAELEPERIFVMAGINDIEGQVEIIDSLLEQYDDVLSALTTTGADVYLQSTLECRECGTDLASVRELNLRLESLAKSDPNIEFIDLNSAMADDDGLRAEFTYDGVHLNPSGYVAWRAVLVPYVGEAGR